MKTLRLLLASRMRSATEETLEASPQQGRLALSLLREAIGQSIGRFVAIVVMSVLTAALESVALVLLPALLGLQAATPSRLVAAHRMDLPSLFALYLGLVALAAALLYDQTVLSNRLTLDFGKRLRTRLHAALLRAEWGTAAMARPADYVHALTAEAAQCANATQTAIQLATRLVYLPSFLAAALILSPQLAIAVLLLAAAASLPMLALARRAYASAIAMARASRHLHGDIADDVAGLKTIKSLRAEPARCEAFGKRLDETYEASLVQARATAAVQAWQRFAAAAIATVGAIYGLSVLRLDAVAMLALAIALARLASGVAQALDLWRQLGRLLPVWAHFRACERRCVAAAEPDAAVDAPRLRDLRLQGVGYTHPGASAPTVSGIDLALRAHAITVLTGPSGAGKSTLADMIMGLTAPTTGAILINGVALDGPTRVAWRRNVAYVPQDPFLFHETIRANLRLADPAAQDADLDRALEAAAATFALRLPRGLDTIVGDRGSRLSGGERQRLVLARALLSPPDLLVLDEATNALDPVSEAEIIAGLRRLAARTTVLVIAHRSAIIEAADCVLRLEDGAIVCERDVAASERAAM